MSKAPTNSAAKVKVPDIRARKGGTPIVAIVGYTAPIAKIVNNIVDFILVGDSLGMTVYGASTTVGVTMDSMIEHGKAVVRSAPRPCIIVDMPFGSYEANRERAFDNAARIMAETGCDAVKLEGGQVMAETIAFMVERGIPVVAHIGLQPQRVNTTGGFKTQGRNDESAQAIIADARAVAQAGAFAVVVEAIPESLATRVTEAIDVPTIGIGASRDCDGQILLIDDLIGLFRDFTPRFVKKYANVADIIEQAVKEYARETVERTFPGKDHVFKG